MTALLTDALNAFGLDGAEAVFLRHNENLTYRVADKYLLRIHRAADGLCIEHSHPLREAELAFLRHLAQHGLPVQTPIGTALLPDGTQATLLTYLPGHALTKDACTPEVLRQAGQLMHHLHIASEGFHHAALRSYDGQYAQKLADTLFALAQRDLVNPAEMAVACDAARRIGDRLTAARDMLRPIHADLSPSNLLLTPNGLAPIDFSLCGVGHPMHDLGILLGNLSTQAQRQAVAAGYTEAGGQLDLPLLDAGFALGLLEALVLHADRWFREDWFAPRMTRWTNETLAPLAAGKPLLDETMFLINLK
ncbi:MAG: phosphotransferase enzyme family protein [Aristaeellaceae bacterium]